MPAVHWFAGLIKQYPYTVKGGRVTKEDILALKPGHELDRQIATKIFHETRRKQWIKCYSTSVSLAWELETKIAELGLSEEYSDWLTELALPLKGRLILRTTVFAIAHALPEIRCKAALLALQKE